MRVRLKSVDSGRVLSKLERASERAMGVTAENALTDTKPYVPYDTGALSGSGQARVTASGAGELHYGTDADTAEYARVQYYESHDHSTAQNAMHAPRACDHWCERSSADNRDRWLGMYASQLKEGMA